MNPKMIFEILLQILADRVLLFITLFLNAALFGYAVYAPDWVRFATAVAFSLTVFFPVLKLRAGGIKNEEREAA
jgi:hypothetical protein